MPHATATLNGIQLASTSTWEVVDGNIYVTHPPLPLTLILSPHPNLTPTKFPPDSISKSHFSPTTTTTHCPYKGDASYYTITTGKTEIQDAAWYYPQPLKGMAKIEGFVAFYKGKGVVVDVQE